MFNIIEHYKYSEHISFDKIFTQIKKLKNRFDKLDQVCQTFTFSYGNAMRRRPIAESRIIIEKHIEL
jgi:hypothetical protein